LISEYVIKVLEIGQISIPKRIMNIA